MADAAKPIVVVVGSLHYDVMVEATDRPRKGETVAGSRWWPKFGGKGGNQAVAAAAAGAHVRMVGAIGGDGFGGFLSERLARSGIDVSRVATVDGVGSGMSVAIIDGEGDYGAVIVSGANRLIDHAAFMDGGLWRNAGVLVLQNEVPAETNIAAARAARRAGCAVCLNAAPFRPLSAEFAGMVDILIVNALEAEGIGGTPVCDLESALRAAEALAQAFPMVVVTAGGDGVAGARRDGAGFAMAAIPVELVSTHGAGDVFVGSLATGLAEGSDFRSCVAAANAAAAAHVSRRG